MGSSNATCALSNLPLLEGDPCVFLILTRNPCNNGSSLGNYHNAFWFVRSIPLFGTYADYGGMSWDGEEETVTKSIEDQFKVDLRRQRPKAPNEEVSDFEFSDLLDWFLSGEVSVEDPSMTQFIEHYAPLYEKTIREHGPTEEETYKGDKKVPNYKEAKERNQIRSHSRRYFQRAKTLPCTSVLIHRGVWDSFCDFRYEDWDGPWPKTIKDFREDAKVFLTGMRKSFKKASPLRHSDNPADLFRFAVNNCRKENDFSRLFEGSSNSTPPFQSGPETAFEQLLCSNGFNFEDPSVLISADRLCQLAVVERFLLSTRRAWFPTTGAGSQGEDYDKHLEYYIRCAQLAKKAYEEHNAAIVEDRDLYAKQELKVFAEKEKYIDQLLGQLIEPSSPPKKTPLPKQPRKSRKSK